jgi:hypothetical protein
MENMTRMSLYDIYPERIAEPEIPATVINETDTKTSSIKWGNLILVLFACTGLYFYIKSKDAPQKRNKINN